MGRIFFAIFPYKKNLWKIYGNIWKRTAAAAATAAVAAAAFSAAAAAAAAAATAAAAAAAAAVDFPKDFQYISMHPSKFLSQKYKC